MIIVISEQLGNQMFAYATAKTVAQKWGGGTRLMCTFRKAN